MIRHAAPGLGLREVGVSGGVFFHYTDGATSLESLAVYRNQTLVSFRLTGDELTRVRVALASHAVFKVLRTHAIAGRLFTEEDGRPGFMNMRWMIPVLLSHQLWMERFGGDPNVVGRILRDGNNDPRQIVGVLPKGFAFPREDTQMWMLFEHPRESANFASSFNEGHRPVEARPVGAGR